METDKFKSREQEVTVEAIEPLRRKYRVKEDGTEKRKGLVIRRALNTPTSPHT